MTCPSMKRKFDEVEEAVHSCIETLTGYEKCLLQNKLLLARSKMVKYENLAITYKTQIAMAKLDVEIATSDIDLLLEELQRGKRFKTGEAFSTISTSTQTDSQPTLSPAKSVYDTSRISFDLPSVDLTSFTKKRSDNSQEPSTSQGENAQESTTSQGSKDSGYNSSPKSLLISQEILTGHNSSPKSLLISQEILTGHNSSPKSLPISQIILTGQNSSPKSLLISQETSTGHSLSPKGCVNQEIQVDLPSDNTKEGDTETVKSTKKSKPKKKLPTKDKLKTFKIYTNVELKSTEDVLPSNSVSNDKPTNEKPSKFNEEVCNITEKTQNIYSTRGKSVQRRQSQHDRDRKSDDRKSDSYDTRFSAETQKKITDQCDSHKDKPKRREKTDKRKSLREKSETKINEKQSRKKKGEVIKQPSKSQNIEPRDNNRISDDKGDKQHQDFGHKEAKNKCNQAQNKSQLSQKKSEPAKESKNTDPRIKKQKPMKAKLESKRSGDRSNVTTLVITKKTMEVEANLPNQLLIGDFAPYEIPQESPIHYTDFANTILSSVAVTDGSSTTRNTVGMLNSQNTIAQSTPFVRRFATVEDLAPEYEDFPPNVLCSDPVIEDQLNTFIKTTLSDYNRNVAEFNLKANTHTITEKDKTTNDKTTAINCKTTEKNNKKTTRIIEENICRNPDKDENSKISDKSTKINASCKTHIKPKTPEIMVKIPVTRVPDVISHINPTMVNVPVTKAPITINQITTKPKQPCLTVTVNGAGVISIRPRSAENSSQPSPKLETTLMETHRQNIQEKNVNSTSLSYPKESNIQTANEIFKSQDYTTSKLPAKITAPNTKHVRMPSETASYMTQVKDQYYFDANSPRLADEAPTHRNAVSLFRAFSLLMPPSPTFTLSSLSDKENCKSSSPSPPNVQKLPINKKLLDDFVPSYKNETIGSKNNINTSYKNAMNNIYNKKPLPIRRTHSTADTLPRRTIKFIDAQPLTVQHTKPKTTTLKAKTNRRKSLDDRAIMRVLNEPCSSISSKGSSPRSIGARTPNKDGITNSIRITD